MLPVVRYQRLQACSSGWAPDEHPRMLADILKPIGLSDFGQHGSMPVLAVSDVGDAAKSSSAALDMLLVVVALTHHDSASSALHDAAFLLHAHMFAAGGVVSSMTSTCSLEPCFGLTLMVLYAGVKEHREKPTLQCAQARQNFWAEAA